MSGNVNSVVEHFGVMEYLVDASFARRAGPPGYFGIGPGNSVALEAFFMEICYCPKYTVMREIFTDIADSLQPTFYRVGSYVVMTMLDDPAILALGFC